MVKLQFPLINAGQQASLIIWCLWRTRNDPKYNGKEAERRASNVYLECLQGFFVGLRAERPGSKEARVLASDGDDVVEMGLERDGNNAMERQDSN